MGARFPPSYLADDKRKEGAGVPRIPLVQVTPVSGGLLQPGLHAPNTWQTQLHSETSDMRLISQAGAMATGAHALPTWLGERGDAARLYGPTARDAGLTATLAHPLLQGWAPKHRIVTVEDPFFTEREQWSCATTLYTLGQPLASEGWGGKGHVAHPPQDGGQARTRASGPLSKGQRGKSQVPLISNVLCKHVKSKLKSASQCLLASTVPLVYLSWVSW